ncbi:hypothetical protein V493_07666, partial [Pseudogymnoascus sp. VKM F-4281 (FW-2241)]
MRDITDASSAPTGRGEINIIFRIRHPKRGYIWLETHGHARPFPSNDGAATLTLLLTTRERPVCSISHSSVALAGGPSDSDIWTKLSTSGLILYISSSVCGLLDRTPSALIGTSFQALLPPEQKAGFETCLAARGGEGAWRHEVRNKRGVGLMAFTVLYPGDAREGG